MARQKKAKTCETTKVRPPKVPTLIETRSPATMPPPNQLVSLESCDDMDDLGLYHRWPLVQLMDNDNDRVRGIFVDMVRHHVQHCYQWQEHPPTWMDPHIFADMAMKNERVQRILRVAMRKNDLEAWKRIEKLLDEIFDEQYLPYAIAKFSKAKPFLAQWILRAHAYQETNSSKLKKKKARRGQ